MTKPLTAKERILTALEGGVPDRMPATVHQWQPFHLSAYLNGVSDLDAFRLFGLDASLARFPLISVPNSKWVVETKDLEANTGEQRWEVTITTPKGSLSNIVGANPITTWNVTHLVKRHEDLEIIEKYMPVPKLDREALRHEYEELGTDGIMRGFVWGDQGGCWQHACCLMGTQELILEASDNPGWVHEFLMVLWRKKAQFMNESLAGASYDLIETGGGAASSTVISPKYFREFCLPYDVRMHEALHAIGHKVVYHTCGGMMPILELIVENDCDAAETLTPPAMGGDARPSEIKERIGGQVALIGGLDQHTYLENGTPEQIARHVHAMFLIYGSEGGYIASPSDHFFHVPSANLEAYSKAAKDCVYS